MHSSPGKVYFVGIEGGGSHSVAYALDGTGKHIGTADGPGTNLYLEGFDETIKRFVTLAKKVLAEAGVPAGTKLRGLGISSSGCEAEETVTKLRDRLMELNPGLTDHCVICSDTGGIMATALDGGGMCLISGTGSNSLLVNPDGGVHRCGGWSYMLGEKASAWWVSYRAVKWMLEEDDGLRKPAHSSAVLRSCVMDYFNITDRFGLLEHAYTKFEKAHFSGLCKHLGEAAAAGDPLCRQLFSEGGSWLAKFVLALIPRADKRLLTDHGGLHMVAVGGVFNSWSMMRQAFVDEVSTKVPKFTLLKLTGSLALGAAYLAAKKAKFDLPHDLSKNSKVLCQRG